MSKIGEEVSVRDETSTRGDTSIGEGTCIGGDVGEPLAPPSTWVVVGAENCFNNVSDGSTTSCHHKVLGSRF